MKLKRYYNLRFIFIVATVFYSLVLLCSSMICICNIIDINGRIKVEGVYKENTITYTTLENYTIVKKNTTLNIYDENEEIYVYYLDSDPENITTSTLFWQDISTSITLILIFGVIYLIVIYTLKRKIKFDKEIISFGKILHLNISNIIFDRKFIIIVAEYTDKKGRNMKFISEKIYDKKQIEEIKESGSVYIYYHPKNRFEYVIYKYSEKQTQ